MVVSVRCPHAREFFHPRRAHSSGQANCFRSLNTKSELPVFPTIKLSGRRGKWLIALGQSKLERLATWANPCSRIGASLVSSCTIAAQPGSFRWLAARGTDTLNSDGLALLPLLIGRSKPLGDFNPCRLWCHSA
jgi:hypothetical protein